MAARGRASLLTNARIATAATFIDVTLPSVSGAVVIGFSSVVQNPMICGVEIFAGTAPPPIAHMGRHATRDDHSGSVSRSASVSTALIVASVVAAVGVIAVVSVVVQRHVARKALLAPPTVSVVAKPTPRTPSSVELGPVTTAESSPETPETNTGRFYRRMSSQDTRIHVRKRSSIDFDAALQTSLIRPESPAEL